MARLELDAVVPPRLPSSAGAYSAEFQEQYSNVLRLFFNRLTNITTSLVGVNGGQYVDCPNGLFFDTTQHTLALADTGYPITFNQTYLHNAVDLNSTDTSKIEISISGVYNFQFSGSLKSTNASTKHVWIWLVRSGTAIGYSAKPYTLADNDQFLPVSWNFNIDMTAGQYLQVYWAADDTNVTMETEAATTPHPGIPSAVMAVNFIAPVPATLPTPP